MDDRFDLDNAIQTKAAFTYAIAVMDKIGGWREEHLVGSSFAATMWIYTKAMICNGQIHMHNYRLFKFRSIVEAVCWECDDALDEHVWESELTLFFSGSKGLEALQYNIAHPCTVQLGVWWFSAPTNLYNGLTNDGVNVEKYKEGVNLAILAPRSCFLRLMRTALTNTTERVWNLDRDLRGCGLGGKPGHLPDDENSDKDLDSEEE